MTHANVTAATGELRHLDPAALISDRNIRLVTTADRALIESVREHGILEPIVGVDTPAGVRVRFGHRRTLAAIEAGRGLVPVYVTGEEDSDEVARLVAQWHENEIRTPLSTGDRIAATEQLSLLGLSAAQITKRTKASKSDVAQALAASASTLAKGAAQRHEFLTLDQSAAVAEFDTQPETVKAMLAAAKLGEGDFAHVLSRAREDREEAAEIAALVQELSAAGVPNLDPEQLGGSRRIRELLTDQDKALTAATHAACPGHAAYVSTQWPIQIVYVCTDWKANGHRDRRSSNGSGASAGPMDEAAKAERKKVIENNKAWRAAQPVRREFLATLLTRKTAPKGTTGYIAAELVRWSYTISRGLDNGAELAAELLGLKVTGTARAALGEAIGKASDARAQVITFGLVLAAIEHGTDVDTWRRADDTERGYLAYLLACGYSLSDVEQLAAAPPKSGRAG